jgi:hypothetical protein
MLVGTLFAGTTTTAKYCPFDMCVSLYNECEASCNGNRQCIKVCQRDYNECLCANCGFDCGEIPRSEPKARTSGGAAIPGTASGYVPAVPADTFSQRGQALP